MAKSDADRILALEGQLANAMAEKSRLSRSLKAATLNKGLLQAIVDELEAIVLPLDPLPEAQDFRKSEGDIVEEHLVMHQSDEHADEIVEPHTVGGIEHFDFPVALCRAEQYVDTVLDFTQNKLSNYRFPVLHLLQYGDSTSGEIHSAVDRSYYKNMFRNCLAVGQMKALMVRDLAPYFKQIKVLCLSGNHGRRTLKKEFTGARNNWDYLISEITKMHCSHLKNVEFAIPDAFSVNYEVNGWWFNIQHGDNIPSWNGIPWYGIERKTRRMVALQNSLGQKISYFVLGHFHSCSSMADLKGEVLINGAWPATSAYSYESFSGYREPMQLLHGVSAKYGISWRLPVKLKNEEKEKIGPSRYKVILSSDGM